MSSQASSAGRDEAKVRQKLIETGDVDIMIAIRSNFFYTRTVPCELWFLNRDKPEEHRDKVLMIDARNIYRKVTRKIYDFSPSRSRTSWPSSGSTGARPNASSTWSPITARRMLDEAGACFKLKDMTGRERPTACRISPPRSAPSAMPLQPFLETLPRMRPMPKSLKELEQGTQAFTADVEAFRKAIDRRSRRTGRHQKTTNGALKKAVDRLAPLAETSRDLVKQTDLLYKLACRLIEICENECSARDSDALGRPRHHPRPQGRGRSPADRPWNSSNRCATSGSRPTG